MSTATATATEAADTSCALYDMPEVDNVKRDRAAAAAEEVHEEIFFRQPESESTAAELQRDEILFKQPESTHLGDCPICFLPLQIDPYKSTLQSCCSKVICKGCRHANKLRGGNKNLHHTCLMCRQPTPRSKKEISTYSMKRVAANDPVAIQERGKKHYQEGHYRGAFEYWTKAAELGNVDAIYLLSLLYRDGRGVEKNEEKEWHQLEEAAIAGHVGARFTLAHNEKTRRGRTDRAVKHLIIAANLGCDYSMKALKQCHENGEVDDDKFTTALHAHQAAVDEMNSPQREEQANYDRSIEEWFCADK
jgi:TPR repeat protein